MSEKDLIIAFALPIEDIPRLEVCCEVSRTLMKCSGGAIVTTNFGYAGSNRVGGLPSNKAMKMQVILDACTLQKGRSIQ